MAEDGAGGSSSSVSLDSWSLVRMLDSLRGVHRRVGRGSEFLRGVGHCFALFGLSGSFRGGVWLKSMNKMIFVYAQLGCMI